jgi:hypothetical protein
MQVTAIHKGASYEENNFIFPASLKRPGYQYSESLDTSVTVLLDCTEVRCLHLY